MTTQTQSINEIITVSVDDSTLDQIVEANTLSTTVKSLKITNNQEYVNSGEFLKKIKTVSKIIEDRRKEITKPIDDLKKQVMDFFKEPKETLAEAEKMLKTSMIDFQKEQERIRHEQEQKAIALARAEEDRKRRALEIRAVKAEQNGKLEKAEQLREQAGDVYVPTVVNGPTVEKVQGIATKKVWKGKIVDINKIPQNVYINDEKVVAAIQAIVNKLATATKGAMPIEGVEFYQEESLSAGRV